NNDEDPATYEEAMMSPDSNKWQEAMKSEMGSMYDNKVWTLVDLPDSRKAVENKWIFKRKTDADGMEHWTAVKNILKYLKRTKDMFLCYGGDQELVVTSYTDASWNTDPDDSKSQSGYVFILNGAAVSWASSKQCTVAKSSRIEYIGGGFIEAVWMKRFIVELGVVPSALDPLIIYCDNMGAIANAQEPRSHKRLKHIKLRYHSIREYIEDGELQELCDELQYANMNKELPELFGMLKAAEIEIKKEHQVLMVNKTTSFKKQGKSKGKFKKGGKKAATPPMKPKNGPKPMLSAILQGEGTPEA
ncbi:hypothetical protein QYE76_018088, partial [Lolium multiflorum]